MKHEETKKRLKKMADDGNESAKWFLAMIGGIDPSMQNIFFAQAEAALGFADVVIENSENPDFLRALENRGKKSG